MWDARDAWDDGFLKLAFGASRWNLANHRQRALHMNQNRRIQCNRQGAFAQDLAAREGQRPRCQCGGESRAARTLPLPEAFVLRAGIRIAEYNATGKELRAGFSQASARSFAHRIPHEMIEASSLCEALRHLPLENQMSHASHASHTSHPQAESKARSTPTSRKQSAKHIAPTHQPQQNNNKKGRLK